MDLPIARVPSSLCLKSLQWEGQVLNIQDISHLPRQVLNLTLVGSR